MLVVADSSPINILVRVGLADLLPKLFSSVIIPPEVRDELFDARTPAAVRAFVASPPAWFTIQNAINIERIPGLDAGEEAAISLARQVSAEALLIDDRDGRRAATQRGIPIIGTLGVLEAASARGLHSLAESAALLNQTDFRIDPALIQHALAREVQRRGPGPR